MMIYVHGSKILIFLLSLILLSFLTLGCIKLSEKKVELTKNIKEWEIKSSILEKNNKLVQQELEK